MKKNILNLVTLSAMLFAVSCNKVNELPDEPTNVGKVLIPTTLVKGEYIHADGDEATVPYDVKDFTVTISKYGDDGTLTPVEGKHWKLGDMPGKVGLLVGEYAIQAASYAGKQLEVSDIPYFFGTQDFKIAFEDETKVTLDIKVVDAKVSLETSDAFKLAFTDWSMKVVTKADATKQLFELNQQNPTKYMKPTDVVLHFAGTRRNSPVTWNKTLTVDNVKPGDWIRAKLLEDAVGTVTVNIVIDNSLTEREVIIEIPNDDEDLGGGGTVTPDPEEPEEPEVPTFDKPAIVGLDGLNVDEVLVVNKALAAPTVKIKISADNGGIEKLKVTIDSQEAWFMPIINILFEGNSFDLANIVKGSVTEKTLKEDLQIISDDVPIKGEKSFTFDISNFMTLLNVNKPATNSYDFTIAVEDKAGDTMQKKLVVRVINEAAK